MLLKPSPHRFPLNWLQEDGVATAIESLYRDMEYARSLIKRPVGGVADSDGDDDEIDAENGTIRHRRPPTSPGLDHSGYNSCGSAKGAPSEDWSVISEQDDRRSSSSSSNHHESRRRSVDPQKRNSLAAAVLSVLPDAFTPGSPRRQSISSTQS